MTMLGLKPAFAGMSSRYCQGRIPKSRYVSPLPLGERPRASGSVVAHGHMTLRVGTPTRLARNVRGLGNVIISNFPQRLSLFFPLRVRAATTVPSSSMSYLRMSARYWRDVGRSKVRDWSSLLRPEKIALALTRVSIRVPSMRAWRVWRPTRTVSEALASSRNAPRKNAMRLRPGTSFR